MSKIKVNKEKLKDISDAVKTAELKTSGEISTAFIRESDSYAFYELSFGLVMGFIYFSIMMAFSNQLEQIIKGMFWDYQVGYLTAFIGFSTFLIIALFYLLSNIPSIDRLIIPKKIRERKVYERALRYFAESGTYDTKDKTGILIFISLLEQRVELISDKGINKKIDQNEWDSIVTNIVSGVKSGDWVKNLSESIIHCGDLLEKHFPIQADDKNELRDEIVMLEK